MGSQDAQVRASLEVTSLFYVVFFYQVYFIRVSDSVKYECVLIKATKR